MKALITGGAGNLGRKLAQLFVENGDTARVFDLPQVDYSFFDGMAGVEIVKGDIRNVETIRQTVAGVDVILHLAALIPPASESNRDFTMSINVGGTKNLLDAVKGTKAHFILASSVATYGDTSAGQPPVKVDHVQAATDIYGETKIASERLAMESGLPYTILRIAPISVPEVLEPPEEWPYMADQRVEFVNRDDVAAALFSCATKPEARGKILNIAGGPSWQVLGRKYVGGIYEALDLDLASAKFSQTPGWFDWYDTVESQALLKYQHTTLPEFLLILKKAAEEAFGW